jgi:hypothetical protein
MMLWTLHVVLGLLSCSNNNNVGPHGEIRFSHRHNARRLLAAADYPTDLLSENRTSEQFEGNKTSRDEVVGVYPLGQGGHLWLHLAHLLKPLGNPPDPYILAVVNVVIIVIVVQAMFLAEETV